MSESNDPRTYFAAERTLLAWIRTGISVIGLGFVVARFSLFLSMMRANQTTVEHPTATLVGISLVILGSGAIAIAGRQHGRFMKDLPLHDRPRNYNLQWSVWFAGSLSSVGVILAIYMALRAIPG